MTSQPRLVLTAEDPSFDSVTIQNWKDEGYDVTYLPFTGSHPDFERNLQHLADPLEMGEKYAIVGVLLSCILSPKHRNSTNTSKNSALCTYRLSTLRGRESLLRICLVCSVRRIRDRGSGYVHQTDAEAVRSHRLLSQPDPFACCRLPPESPCLSPRGRIARVGPQIPLVLVPGGAAWVCRGRSGGLRPGVGGFGMD